jgi:hypothetical protein
VIRKLRAFGYRELERFRESFWVCWLTFPVTTIFRPKPRAIPVIASVTSYPPRITASWIAIETLLRQTVQPTALILVLSEEEFPHKRLPRKIITQTKRGLTIMWVAENNGSFDKLLPVRKKFPHSPIMTFDDDKFFPRNLMESLYKASERSPGFAIGARGWRMGDTQEDGIVRYGKNWTRASAGETGRLLLMPGGNGVLYPSESLSPLVDDVTQARALCPTADDVWFWAALTQRETPSLCLGLPPHKPVSPQRQTVALADINNAQNDAQFQRAVTHFGLSQFLADQRTAPRGPITRPSHPPLDQVSP